MSNFFAKLLTFKTLKIAAFMAFFAVSAVAVSAGSQAAFTGSAPNTGNSYATGYVELHDSNVGHALFAAANIVPGFTQSRCIRVQSNSTLATNLFMSGSGDNGPLGDALTVDVTPGTGTQPDCSDFAATGGDRLPQPLNVFSTSTAAVPYALGTLDGGGGAKTVMITVTLPSDANSTLMSKGLNYDFLFTNQA